MLRTVLAFAVLFLVGCSTGYAPVSDQSLGVRPEPTRLAAGEYRVQSGDTLFGIAFKLGVDPRELQRTNNIRDKNRIFVGQVLKTEPAPSGQKSVAPQKVPTKTKKNSQNVVGSEPRSTPAAGEVAAATNIKWRWPHDGKVLARYSSAEGGNKGLDISGKIGDPVFAAAEGTVVYAGSGLLGYGNLVIISHNQDFLSAYAHNSRILVRENQKVKQGELVAEIGNTGASVPMLHFEVRRDGRPVDPLRYLPKR